MFYLVANINIIRISSVRHYLELLDSVLYILPAFSFLSPNYERLNSIITKYQNQNPSLKSLHRILRLSVYLRVSLHCNRPRLLKLFLLLLSLVNIAHQPTHVCLLLAHAPVYRSTSVRLAAFDWSTRLFFPLLRGGGSEPLCPRSGTFLAKFSTV